MRRFVFFILFFSNHLHSLAQSPLAAPKLVVGIVVDQMRWDFLYRYYNRYAEDGGFKRLLKEGFRCENTFIPFLPTVTACGHASIYTGSVPAIDGITGNDWVDYNEAQIVYCTQDDSVHGVGGGSESGQMSPHRLLVTTIGDELRLASNFRSKVIGIALKDRSAILPAGHSANGAYWYDDKTGDWMSSSYYLSELPGWVQELNEKKLADNYFLTDWNTLYPLETYRQSTPDLEPYESTPFGPEAKGFPYKLKQYIGKGYALLPVTPYGNTMTFEMSKAAILGESLGSGSETDLLAISLSTPDYIGHTFGPNSVEAEDDFLRLDKDLGDFLRFLDSHVGKGAYLIFLSADHGVAQVPAYLKEHKIPAGAVESQKLTDNINRLLKEKFKVDKLALGMYNYQIFLDRELIEKNGINKQSVEQLVVNFLMQQKGVFRAFAMDHLQEVTLAEEIKKDVANSYYPSRSGDIQVMFLPQWLPNFTQKGSTHGSWNNYDTHIPLIWYGWNVQTGRTDRQVYMTDIAPTLATMLHIQMPSGSVGQTIEGVSR